MSPVETAITSVSRAISSFHPLSMPRLARRHYRRESVAWACLSLGIGAVEGGVTGVIAKNIFEGVVDAATLNLTVAILAGAPAFANIASFLWAGLSHGKHKIRFLVGLQTAAMAFVAMVAIAPRSPVGLMMLTIAAVGSRMCWSGVVTLRSTVWRANYTRDFRANMAGKITTIQAILITASSFVIGGAMDLHQDAFRFLYPLVALTGVAGAWIYRGMRMRGHRALLAVESSDETNARGRISPLTLRRVLLDDHRFRKYMTVMFVFGAGNLMIGAPLVIVLKEQFGLGTFPSVLIASTIPFLLMPISIPFWSRLLDRVHIIEYRAYHAWAFVVTGLAVLIAAVFHIVWLLYLAAVLKGIAFGGGVLGWNLGHHDFAPVEKASQYMGVHVTLTGVRGVLVPIIGVSIYQMLEYAHEGSGVWVFAPCLALSLVGAIGFVLMRRTLSGPGHDSTFEDGPPVQSSAAG